MKLINKKNSYILLLFIICLLMAIIIPTYAKFASNYITDEDIVGMSLDFEIGISNIEEYEEITVSAGSQEQFNIQITNSNDSVSYYGTWYKMIEPTSINDDISIGKLEGTEVSMSGSINSGGVIMATIGIINNGTSDIKLNIGVASSMTSINDIEYLNGKQLITGEVGLSTGPEYFLDAYSSTISLVRRDGATAQVSTSDSSITWYGENTQEMNICEIDNDKYFWCIGEDNNAYYKTSNSDATWTKVDTSAYIDVANYSYFMFSSSSGAYIVRSDGKTNLITTSGLESTTWSYGADLEMSVCSGYGGSGMVYCIGKDGYYYNKFHDSTESYSVGSQKSTRTPVAAWLDISVGSMPYLEMIESDGTNLYTNNYVYLNVTPTWYTSTIPGGGIKNCTSYGGNNYCVAEDNYLYYKSSTATTWTKSSISVE